MKKSSAKLIGVAAAAVVVIVALWWLLRREQLSETTEPNAPAIHAPTAPKPESLTVASAQNATDTVQGFRETALSDEARVGKFRDWMSRYQLTADPAAKGRLEAEGDVLAQERREVMARLIEQDPQRALQEAIPYRLRQQLPESITRHLEQTVSGRGTLGVLGVLPDPDSNEPSVGIVRTAHLNGQEYRAFVYGRRLSQPTAQGI